MSDKTICEKLRATKVVVIDSVVKKLCVCVTKLFVKVCVCERLFVTKLCVKTCV